MQLQLFPETKEQLLEVQLLALQEQVHKLRKSLFAQQGELSKLYLECRDELEEMKKRLELLH